MAAPRRLGNYVKDHDDPRGLNILEVHALDTLPNEEKLYLIFRDNARGTTNSRFFNHPKKEYLHIPQDLLEFVLDEDTYTRYRAIGNYYVSYQIFSKDNVKTKYTYDQQGVLLSTQIVQE